MQMEEEIEREKGTGGGTGDIRPDEDQWIRIT